MRLTREGLTAWGERFGREARAPRVVTLAGDLGAGKTTLAQAICRGYGVTDPVTSPTFSLVHEYAGGATPVYHLDLYRLRDARDLVQLGWDEIAAAPALVLVEWPERAEGALPPDATRLTLAHVAGDDEVRELRIDGERDG
ncbi:MAG TPA: tRNA (adenosine(37)-N6)-threonylcarbamoyltransferase complex ATPase subunit type 1 TsaE [Gemmatimonadaceae bacterium]|nr:tRNA (adenosine(37)-N6)-threonylcarbamoyltransferase complex ATPase subunit type 1 TsaE [Gemmatimonadaceae bacterium]